MLTSFQVISFQQINRSDLARLHWPINNQDNLLWVLQQTSSNIGPLCWIPSCAIFLTSVFLEQYPIQIAVWTIIAVTPINALLNPVVFTALILQETSDQQKDFEAQIKQCDRSDFRRTETVPKAGRTRSMTETQTDRSRVALLPCFIFTCWLSLH